MTSSLEIANEALVRIGVPPVPSFDDATAQGLVLSALYAQTRRRCLADHPWAFALRESQLPKLVLSDPDLRLSEWDFVYQLPTDSLRVLGLKSFRTFAISGDQLYTHDAAARLVYVSDVDEPGWPAYFVHLVVLELAAALAISLTDSSSRADTFYVEARRERPRIRAIDSVQTPPFVFDLMRILAKRSYNPLAGS